jgi:hypothetical protein
MALYILYYAIYIYIYLIWSVHSEDTDLHDFAVTTELLYCAVQPAETVAELNIDTGNE